MKAKPEKITETAFARSLGISVQALRKHSNKQDAPKIGDIEGWKIFLAAHGREGTSPTDIHRKTAEKKLSILTTKDKREKAELEKLLETLIPRDESRRAITRFVAGLVHRLLPIALRVSQRFALESDPQTIEAQLNKELRDAINGADEFKYGLLDCPKCKQPIQI